MQQTTILPRMCRHCGRETSETALAIPGFQICLHCSDLVPNDISTTVFEWETPLHLPLKTNHLPDASPDWNGRMNASIQLVEHGGGMVEHPPKRAKTQAGQPLMMLSDGRQQKQLGIQSEDYDKGCTAGFAQGFLAGLKHEHACILFHSFFYQGMALLDNAEANSILRPPTSLVSSQVAS